MLTPPRSRNAETAISGCPEDATEKQEIAVSAFLLLGGVSVYAFFHQPLTGRLPKHTPHRELPMVPPLPIVSPFLLLTGIVADPQQYPSKTILVLAYNRIIHSFETSSKSARPITI